MRPGSAPPGPWPGRPSRGPDNRRRRTGSGCGATFRLPSNLGESLSPSVQPFSGTWQVSHVMAFVFDNRGSKKSCFPSATLPGVTGLSAGTSIGLSWSPLGGVKPAGSAARAPGTDSMPATTTQAPALRSRMPLPRCPGSRRSWPFRPSGVKATPGRADRPRPRPAALPPRCGCRPRSSARRACSTPALRCCRWR